MPERIVVSFRGIADVEHDSGQSYLDRAMAIKERSEKLGATLCSWSAQTFSFELNFDEIETAVSLAVSVVTDPGPPEERFRVGISQGPMSAVCEAGAPEVLSWGPPLLNAIALARVARAGEVLLDPKLVVTRPGELLLLGMRVAVDGERKLRGARLDTRQPWRKQAARAVSTIRESAIIGRDALLSEIVVPVGCICVLRADPGLGGSRLLTELTQRLAPSRTLVITPVGASREPLGAIRRALARSAVLHGAFNLPDTLKDALSRILAGEGTDRWSASELIDAWLAPSEGRFGVLAVDDASEIDVVSLEAVAGALAVRGSFRAIVRLTNEEPIPGPLSTTPVGSTLTAAPLERIFSHRIADELLGGAISPDAVKRWSKRGGGYPLGIREALAEGITTGELCQIEGTAVPRRKSSGRGGAGTPRHWIERRMAYLSEGERAALIALAMLGGDASETMIDALAVGMGGPGAHSAVVGETLLVGGWAARPEPGWLKLTSRTARDALLATLNDDARRQWNLAAAGMLRHYSGLLGHADAAWYAAQAGDHYSAAELALDAARAAEAASLDAAAAVLREFARSFDGQIPSTLPESVRRSITASLFPPSDESGDAGSDTISPGFGGSSYLTEIPPPSDLSDELRRAMEEDDEDQKPAVDPRKPAETAEAAEAAEAEAAEAEEAEEGERPSLELDLDEMGEAPKPQSTKPPKRTSPTEAAIQLTELAKQALVQGDITTLEHLINRLRLTGEHSDLVERMSGFVALGRGAKAEALRKLRAAARMDQPPAQRARALLAYGVALAATGNTEAALLEALDALSCAREVGDRHGEEACARFLARLSSASGYSDAAVAWANVVKRVSIAPRG